MSISCEALLKDIKDVTPPEQYDKMIEKAKRWANETECSLNDILTDVRYAMAYGVNAWEYDYYGDMMLEYKAKSFPKTVCKPKESKKLKFIKWILGVHSPSLGRRVKFKDIFDKHYLG